MLLVVLILTLLHLSIKLALLLTIKLVYIRRQCALKRFTITKSPLHFFVIVYHEPVLDDNNWITGFDKLTSIMKI